MPSLDVSRDTLDRYERLADHLEGFESGEQLVAYILNESVDDLEQRVSASEQGQTADIEVDDDAIRQRLKQLGYIG